MKKFYYQVIIPTTEEVINPCYEPGEDQDSVSVSFKLLEKGVQIVRVQAKEWNKIETLEDAMYKLGLDDPRVQVYRNNKYLQEKSEKDVLAYLKLRIITAAINDGWEPKYAEGETRWYPWFYFYTDEALKKMSDKDRKCLLGGENIKVFSKGVLTCAYEGYASSASGTGDGINLVYESKEKADYAGRKFIDIYADYLLP